MSSPPPLKPPTLDYRRANDTPRDGGFSIGHFVQWMCGFFVPYAVLGVMILLGLQWPFLAAIWLLLAIAAFLLINLYVRRRFDWHGLFPGALMGIAWMIVLWCAGIALS